MKTTKRGRNGKAVLKTLENTPARELIAQEIKQAEKLAAKVKAGTRIKGDPTPKKNGKAQAKPEAKKAEGKKPTREPAPKSGVGILLACVREAGPKGITMEEIIAKVKGKMPNKNPKTMIPRTLRPYLTTIRGFLELKNGRFIATQTK